jgi:fibronectin-binding autotransporter adhesin
MNRVVSVVAAITALTLSAASGAAAETRSDLVLTGGDVLAVSFDQPYGVVTCPAVPVVVTGGPVSLGGATLDVATSFPPGAGYGCVLIDNRGTDAVSGTFAGLGEGTIFGPPSARFRITYSGGDGNDVLLKRVEVPTRIAGPAFDAWYRDEPWMLSVYVGGDTPTALAAAGALTVTVDGVVTGTFPLQFSSATVNLGTLAVGAHTVEFAYGGGMHGGDLVFMPVTTTGTITVKPAPIASLPGGVGPFPPPPGPPSPAAPVQDTGAGTPAPPSGGAAEAGAAPEEPRAGEIRAGLRDVTGASLSGRRLTFVQTIPAAGTVRWQLIARADGRLQALAAGSQPVDAARTVTARLTLDARARRLMRRAPKARVVLRTTLVTQGGREVGARARVR